MSETNEPDRRETFIPDGDFEGFKWVAGKWVHQEKIFNFQLKDGAFPMDEQLYDDDGKANEERLQKATDKNLEKKNTTPPKKNTTTPPKKGGGN